MKFNFKAFDKDGNFKEGSIESSSKESAVIALQNQGLIVTFISSAGIKIKLPIFGKTPLKEIAFFTREMHFLVKARIPLDSAVRTLSEQIPNIKLKNILNDIYNDIVAGISLSKAMTKHKIFSPYYIKMIQIGEVSGSLEEVTDYLATHIENQNKFLGKLIQSLVYPIMVLGIFLATMITLFLTVIPKIAKIFTENEIPMPVITKIFNGFSVFLIHNWMYVILFFVALVYSTIEYLKTREGKIFLFNFLDKLPIINETVKTTYLLRFLESLSFLIKGGLPIPESLNIVAESVGNPIFEDTLKFIAEETKKGSPVSSALKAFPHIFPPLIVQSFITGEKTGQLREILFSISGFYLQELETRTATFSENIQPILIVILAAGLGFLEASLLIPMLNLTKAVQSF